MSLPGADPAAEPLGGEGTEARPEVAGRIDRRVSPLAEHVAAWLKRLAARGKKPKTIAACRQLIGAAIRDKGWTSIEDLTERNIVGWLDDKKAAGDWKGATFNRNLVLLRSFTRFLHRTRDEAGRRLLAEDPLTETERAEDDGGDGARAATTDEARAIVRYAWAREQTDRRCKGGRALYWTALFLGACRADEPANWRWKHLDLDAEVPHIAWSKTLQKNRKAQPTALHPELIRLLREHRAAMRGAAPVGRGRTIRPCDSAHSESFVFGTVPPRCTFRKDRDKAGIRAADGRGRGFSCHSARKWASTTLRNAGVDDAMVNRLLRHSGGVESRYDDRDLGTQALAIARLPGIWPDVHNFTPARIVTDHLTSGVDLADTVGADSTMSPTLRHSGYADGAERQLASSRSNQHLPGSDADRSAPSRDHTAIITFAGPSISGVPVAVESAGYSSGNAEGRIHNPGLNLLAADALELAARLLRELERVVRNR